MTKTNTDKPMFLSIADTAREMGICTVSVRKAISNGTVKTVRIGNRILVPRMELMRLAGMAEAA